MRWLILALFHIYFSSASNLDFSLRIITFLTTSFVAEQIAGALSAIDHPACVKYRRPCQTSFLSISRLILSSGHPSSFFLSCSVWETKEGGTRGGNKQKRNKKWGRAWKGSGNRRTAFCVVCAVWVRRWRTKVSQGICVPLKKCYPDLRGSDFPRVCSPQWTVSLHSVGFLFLQETWVLYVSLSRLSSSSK